MHLLLYNSENCLEGTIRSLVHLSRLKGRPIILVVHDYGSTDQTEQILQALQQDNPFLLKHVEIVTGGNVSLISLEQEDPHYIDHRFASRVNRRYIPNHVIWLVFRIKKYILPLNDSERSFLFF